MRINKFTAILAAFSMITFGAEGETVINLLTDCSHDYSFNLSNASRNESRIFPGINCFTSGRTISSLDLEPINALVVLIDGKLPYLPDDAPHILDYVREGGGVYIGIRTGGVYAESVAEFLLALGLQDAGPRLAKDPANFGISAHAPSELVFELDGTHERFTSRAGPWADYRGSVSFEVYGDGERLYCGEVLRNGARESIDIGIKGVKELRLVATDGGDNKHADGSIWFDPRLVAADGTGTRLLLKDATSVKVGWAQATQDIHFNGNPLGIERAADVKPNERTVIAADHPAAVADATWQYSGLPPNVKPVDEDVWQPIYCTGEGQPVVVTRRYGKGIIVADTSGIYHAANGENEPGRAAMRKLIEYMSQGKKVSPGKGGGGWQFSDGYRWDLVETTDDGLRIHHNAYTKMYVPNDIRAYRQVVRYLTELTGLDEKRKAAQIKELEDRKKPFLQGTGIDVDVSGVNQITLITTDGGNGNGFDHSIFADAWFVDAEGRKTPLRIDDASLVEVGWGKPHQDRLNNGNKFSIGGREFETGVFLHANGRMVIPIDGKYTRFTSWVGLNDGGSGSAGFKVLGDGKVLWDDGVVYLGGRPGGNPDSVDYVPDGVLFQLKYLACVGAGFLLPQGAAVDLPPGLKDDWQAHLGMFAHEMGHAWSYPFCENMGEEASAFIFNNLILHRHHGQKHGDSVTGRLMNYLKNGDIDDVDLARNANNFKYYMFIDLMIREYGEGVWKNYNLLKYALLNKQGSNWTPHTAAWLWSIAAGRDVFPYFQDAFGTSVDKDKAELPSEVMAVGFDPIAVGKLYDVPLTRLPQVRDIFSRLRSFEDVRLFYAKEHAEKGKPRVEG